MAGASRTCLPTRGISGARGSAERRATSNGIGEMAHEHGIATSTVQRVKTAMAEIASSGLLTHAPLRFDNDRVCRNILRR